MELRDVRRLAALGEGPHLEFKRRVPRPERIAKEVIALANTGGGKLLLGVDDDGSVVGLKDVSGEAYALDRALGEVEPPLKVRVEPVEVTRRREVLVVDVPDSAAKPHFLTRRNEQGQVRKVAYVRTGSQSIEASREVVRVMKAERNPRDTRFTFGEKERQLMRYLETYERITLRQYARLVDLPPRRASQTLVLLTRAGLLKLHPDEREDFWTLAYAGG